MTLRYLCLGLPLLLVSEPALACTLCHSDVSQVVRARLAGADFLENLLAVMAPMPVLLAAVYTAARGR
jgi:hypothetical protein